MVETAPGLARRKGGPGKPRGENEQRLSEQVIHVLQILPLDVVLTTQDIYRVMFALKILRNSAGGIITHMVDAGMIHRIEKGRFKMTHLGLRMKSGADTDFEKWRPVERG